MTSQHDKAKRWQFGLRELLLAMSLLSFCFALAARGHLATVVFLLAMPLWCWTCIQCAIGCAAVLSRTPRFTLGTLAVVVTLVCVYSGCWEITRQGRDSFDPSIRTRATATCPAPFVIISDDIMINAAGRMSRQHRHCYVWFFGFVAKLPFGQDVALDPGPPVSIGLSPDGKPTSGLDFGFQP